MSCGRALGWVRQQKQACGALLTRKPTRGPTDEPGERVGDQRRDVRRPTAREAAHLLGELQQMLVDADGCGTGIPPGLVKAWLARNADVLTSIADHDMECDHTEQHNHVDRHGRRERDSNGRGPAPAGAVHADGEALGDLRRARVACGLSLDAAAHCASVSRSHLSRVERGLCGASPAVLARLAATYQAGSIGRDGHDHSDDNSLQSCDDGDHGRGAGRGRDGGRLRAAAAVRARARQVAESLPPLTDEQHARLAALLAPAVTAHARTARTRRRRGAVGSG